MDERAMRELEARVMNLEVEYQPVSKHDLEKRWVAVRETLDAFNAKLGEAELARRGLNDTVAKVLQQNQTLLELLGAQSVQLETMRQELNVAVTRLDELTEE